MCVLSLRICSNTFCVVWQHTLETALLSASQELSEQSDSSAAATQSLVQQRDVLQNGLLSTCRELSRVSTVSTLSHIKMLSHITRHVATFMHEKQPQFYGIGPAAEYLLRVSQWTPRLLMESKNQLLLVLL